MKRMLLLCLGGVLLGTQLFSQSSISKRATINPLQDISVEKIVSGDRLPLLMKPANPSVSTKLTPQEAIIGTTRYDLQTNSTCMNRIWLYPDGTIGAVWTQGLVDGSFSDRGTGYNYFDGTSWGSQPGTRIESVRTGWPSYAPYGATGEAILSHDFATTGGLVLSTRSTKGSGTWSQSTHQGPAGHIDLAWPRMVTSGTDYNTLQVISITKSTVNGGTPYMGLEGAILYSRSSDGGLSWNPQNIILPGMESTDYAGFPADAYAWAAPVGDTLAFIVGDNWFDLFMMKSTDGGTNWTKTIIFEHPYPLFDETTTLVLDTPTVCDGSMGITLDKQGNAHVVFGLMRVLNTDLTDAQTSYFPFTDGVVYWKEGEAPFSTLDIDSVDTRGNLIGWMQDLNLNDTIDFIGGSESIGLYFASLNTQPNITVDDEGSIFVVWSGLTEGKDNGIQMFRHIWGRAKYATSTDWSGFLDLTGSIIHNFDECVYPVIAARSDDNFHFIYQADEEPGLHIQGDEDAPTDNSIIYTLVPKADFGAGFANHNPAFAKLSEIYPNPSNGQASIDIELDQARKLRLEVLSLTGQLHLSSDEGLLQQGMHTLCFDTQNLSAGVYFVNVSSGKSSVTKKLIVQ